MGFRNEWHMLCNVLSKVCFVFFIVEFFNLHLSICGPDFLIYIYRYQISQYKNTSLACVDLCFHSESHIVLVFLMHKPLLEFGYLVFLDRFDIECISWRFRFGQCILNPPVAIPDQSPCSSCPCDTSQAWSRFHTLQPIFLLCLSRESVSF